MQRCKHVAKAGQYFGSPVEVFRYRFCQGAGPPLGPCVGQCWWAYIVFCWASSIVCWNLGGPQWGCAASTSPLTRCIAVSPSRKYLVRPTKGHMRWSCKRGPGELPVPKVLVAAAVHVLFSPADREPMCLGNIYRFWGQYLSLSY
jgi:hypothetical protein